MTMKGGKNKRKWKSLTLKVEHLRLELEDRTESMEDITAAFMEELSQVAEEDTDKKPDPEPVVPVAVDVGDQGEHTSADEVLPTSADPEIPEEIKGLWKQIAKVAHPDKTGGDEKKTELYKRAASAMASGNVDEIVSVASELGFDLPEASEASVTRLEKVANDLQGRLENLENSVLWQWAKAPPNKRAAIMALYMKSKGLRPKKKT